MDEESLRNRVNDLELEAGLTEYERGLLAAYDVPEVRRAMADRLWELLEGDGELA